MENLAVGLDGRTGMLDCRRDSGDLGCRLAGRQGRCWLVVRLELMQGYQASKEVREDAGACACVRLAGACATLGLDGIRILQEKGLTETQETGAERAVGRAVNVNIR